MSVTLLVFRNSCLVNIASVDRFDLYMVWVSCDFKCSKYLSVNVYLVFGYSLAYLMTKMTTQLIKTAVTKFSAGIFYRVNCKAWGEQTY